MPNKILLLFSVGSILLGCATKRSSITGDDAAGSKNNDSVQVKEMDLQKYYSAYNLDGMFVIYDADKKLKYIYNSKYLNQETTPASTFNIITSLISLEEKLLKDEHDIIKYDGYHQSRHPDNNKDLPLDFAFKRNTDWAFLKLRMQIGQQRMKDWIKRLHYGNEEMPEQLDTVRFLNSKTDSFWVVSGALRITPAQQLGLIEKLYNEALPFSKENQRIVKNMMLIKDSAGVKLSGKQGSYRLLAEGKYIGWHIGWIEKQGNVFFYVNYLETPNLQHPTIAKAQKEITLEVCDDLDTILYSR